MFEYCDKVQDKEVYVRIMSGLAIEKEWVFPIIGQLLDDGKYSSTLMGWVLKYLHQLLGGNLMKEQKNIYQIIYWVRSYQIDTKLYDLYGTK